MKKIFFLLIISLLYFGIVSDAQAIGASLYLSPSTGTYTVGNNFSVQVRVNTGGVAINAIDGTLVFNPDKLEVRSVSKSDSILSLWVQEPNFSNSLGTVTFAGGKPTPGYTGASGIIITITFRAKTATFETATVSFGGGSVLADDGKGTNVLTNMGSGVYKLIAREITPIPPTEEVPEEYVPTGVPAAPEVFSSSHPDPNQWYPNKNPEFNWKLPSDVIGVSLLLNQKPSSNPGPNSDGLMESKNYENIEDGVSYFHIKFENEYGWGTITHRKVLIDTQVPAPFEITVDNEGDPTNPTPIFIFQSEDSVSGIKYYEVKVGDQKATTTASTRENPYRPLPVPPGSQTVEVKAFDRAGNFASASADFEISPLPTPEITKIPKNIRIGEVLEIEGKTLPVLTARIYIQKSKEEPITVKVKPDSEGIFVLSYEKLLTEGNYLVWARAEDERGALSYPTPNYPLEIGLPPFLKFGKIALDYLTTMITLIILIVGLIAVIFYAWYRIEIWRKRVRKEAKEVSQSVTAAFRALSQEVEEQIEKLDRKPGLTKAERDLRDKLQEALGISERFINKELEDVDKELE